MGKKNRRRDGDKREEKTQRLLASKVDAIEAADPTYRNISKLPNGFASLVLQHRFSGAYITHQSHRRVKVHAHLVRGFREARAYMSSDRFEDDKEIWDARDAMALDEADGLRLDEYIGSVVGLQFASMIDKRLIGGKVVGKVADIACATLVLKTVKRWPRLRPHWKRFRRRLCDNCPACADLTELRYMVCSGCGIARYCSEECQRAHWPFHQEECLLAQEELTEAGFDPATGRRASLVL